MNALVAQERNNFKRSALKKLRNDGEVPAVVYGSDVKTKSISINKSELLKALKVVGRNGIFPLNLNGKVKNVILRDYQNDSVTREILHVDFLQVEKDTEIDTKVSVILTGTSIGEKSGGTVKQFIHELDVTAKAKDLPDEIQIDITDFDIGRAVKVGDIKKDYSNCTFKHEDQETVAMVDYVKAQTSEEEEAEGEAVGV
ncbi:MULTISPECIES: 50S ribosomal protein L25 [Sutcliffiella]|uniref:Large ribosomal subunit protein bL25 n=1 Tax=Sutcliffiella cohnii TaxID=33932 RepID=A0A223KKW1_9BACI|nr:MULTISPECIES: 50S ribosomal protein L25 [Sutcliffiella]AST90139.1 50S ribosomal protein L25/general stress protein Ctc [Sutcliffiella cohnii]WBL15787.1 50S ribosomal protein L25 [Sutcliffiella sp. NC1]